MRDVIFIDLLYALADCRAESLYETNLDHGGKGLVLIGKLRLPADPNYPLVVRSACDEPVQ
jgi:hypothetical protein